MAASQASFSRLIVTDPAEHRGLVLALTGAEMVIGHSDTADLILDDRYVSRRQALITVTADGSVTIHDLNSTGGTFVNEERLTAPRVLQPGDVVRFASLATRFEPAVQRDTDTAVLPEAQLSDTTQAVDRPATSAAPGGQQEQASAESGSSQESPAPSPTEAADPVVDRGSQQPGGSTASIRPGLVMGASGAEVEALHEALTVVGLQIDVSERDESQFGPSTVAAVVKLQALAGLAQTGVVDENSLAIIDLALDRLGVRPGDKGYHVAGSAYSVSGTVTDRDGMPLARATVVAFDCDLRARKEIGASVTDSQGAYRIAYDADDLLGKKTVADLQVEVRDAKRTALLASPIMFHAPRQATVDLALGGATHAQPSEFASLSATAAPLLGPLRPAELEESKEHADISFLSGETGISQQHLGFWAVAARLVVTTELPAELFYGLLRAGVPTDANVTVLASSTQGVDLEANAQRLLQGVLSTSAASVTAAVQSAVESNLIPASYAERAPADLGRLTELANQNALTSTQGFGKTSFGSVLDTLAVEASVQERFIALYTAAAGTARSSFWSDLAKNPAFTAAQVADLRFGVIVGRLTRGYLPLITELAVRRSAGQVSGVPDLARLTAADWARLLQQGQNGQAIGVPAFIDAPTPQLAVQTYATMLERFFTRAYPTTAFAARVAAGSGGPFTAAGATASFLDANPKFDLRYTNIDAYAATTEISADIRPTLLAAQRLVKVNSTYSVMSALMADGVQSAQQVYSMGRDRFIAKYGQLPALGATEAARTWAQAEQTYAVALAVATKFNATLSATSPAAAATVLPQDAQTQVAAFPNLQTLFGSVSMCACQDCQSVLGDAAYLVDTLDFLAQRSASGGQSVRDVLLKRRPDIAQIQLSCPNTDTALPYIDLVNELLEDTVAPAGPADPTYMPNRQTTLSTPELDANPEYVNQAAYNTLATAVYPWTLPFDYSLAETRTYLGQLNLSRAQLIRTFQAPGGYPSPQADALAREALGLSALQADIITGGALAAGYQSWDYWGLQQAANTITDPADPTKTVTGTWINVLSQVRVLLARASLGYTDLTRLLNTVFINADSAVTITASPPDSCDVNTMTLSGLTQDVLDRLHRFVRLWRCLGWDPYDLDNAITTMQSSTAAGLSQLSPQFLRQAACATAAMMAYSLPVASAAALFAPAPTAATIATRDIPTLPGDDERYSLYHDLFGNLTVLNPPDAIFTLNASGTEIAAIATTPQLADHSAALTAALGISASDLALAIASFTDGSLTLASLCALYRHTVLATALGVTITELIRLLAIIEAPTATAPYYEVIQPFDGTRPESLAAFAATYATVTAGGLSIEQADYILRDANAANRIALDPVAVGTVLLTLYDGLVKIAAELASSADPTGPATGKELAKFLSPADVTAVMAILAGSSTLSGSDQDSLISTALGPYMNAAAAQASLVGGAALPAGEARFGYVLQNMLAYETQTRSTGLVVQTLAEALGLATATTSLLLTEWFPAASTPGSFLITDFLAIANAALAATTDPVPPSNPAFAPLFTAYATLAKTALIITGLNLSTTDVSWWHESGVAAGWLDPTTLPTAPQAAADGRCYRLCRLINATTVRNKVPAQGATFATLFGAATGATKSAYLTGLAAMTGWPTATLEVLCGDPASDADQGELSLAYPDDYTTEIALSRLLPCLAVTAQTGIPADVSAWTGATVTSDTADAVKQAVKANYPSEQWLVLAKQLRDPLRQQQRDALVSYLLAQPQPAGVSRWLDPDDVFALLLIDVEMCSCMATSRIVQATAAVQLFVQRCFLGLEPEVTVDATADGDWLQWQWMSQYRVWQANREVFLFPENWLDPTLRSDKSPFFADLQQDLSQGDLTADVADTALQNYLEKLETVARLDVCGTFHDLENGQDVLRVLARTQGSPPVYYIREWVGSAAWTAWQKVDLDIASDHVLPVVWNGRPYLFWAVVNVKADQSGQPIPAAVTSSTAPPGPNVHLEVQLAWSQYKQNKWQAKQTAPQTLVFQGGWTSSSVTLKSSFRGDQLEIDVFLDYLKFEGERVYGFGARHVGAYLLGGSGTGVEAFLSSSFFAGLGAVGGASVAAVGLLNGSVLKPDIVAPTSTAFDGDWLMPMATNFLSATRPRVAPMWVTYQEYQSLNPEQVLTQADYFRLITPHQTPTFDSTLPFFYRDNAREYFVVPTIYYQNGNYFTINAPEYVYDPFYKAEYRFWPFYHAFTPLLVSQHNFGGTDALYRRELQMDPASVAGVAPFDFTSYYQPTSNVMSPPPQEAIDFNSDAGYSLYNWEMFHHAPFLIAKSLSTNQQFEQAKHWYEYIFNPAGPGTDPVPQRYWITKPFYQMTAADYAQQQITALMQGINQNDPALEHQVARWRADPFDPDAIAQFRPVAYQRAIVMRYIDNLIAWGDQLFSQDTMETINLATQLYVLAGDLLGPRPDIVPPRVEPVVQTYAQLTQGNLDAFSNELVAAENVIPPVNVNVPTPGGSQNLPNLNTLYFQIPPNSQLLGYWDTVADRLFKIRHCMNIEGVVQQLPLFAPPINPGLLVAAAAAGLDLASVLSDINAPTPPYRFRTVIRQSLELCDQVRGLGAELLAALEKNDAENLARIRSGAEKQLQAAIDNVRARQMDAADQEIDVLAKARQGVTDRLGFYQGRPLMNDWEAAALVLHGTALIPQTVATVLDGTATVAHAFPSVEAGAAGFGGSPALTVHIGGSNVGHASNSGAWVARMIAAIIQTGAELSATLGQYHQRQDEWNLQATLAQDELAHIDSQTLAATIRADVAAKEKAAQDIAVQQASDVDAFMYSKFTSKELYDWMVSQVSTTYFQAYQLAYTMAKAAEQCFRRELAIPDSDYIQFGYWDSLRQGLTAGEKLHYDLRRLESAYYTQNDRELEIAKQVSLLQLDPYALVELRENHSCLINLPEILFDLDNPGHYMRRLKTVALTFPCVVGPYTSVSATLTLLSNQIRTSTDVGAGYPRTSADSRFTDDPGGSSEIVTSGGRNDSGLFELRLEDERYLPFEDAGAISTWRLTLNNVYPQFDYSTISDVVLQLRYTARDGGVAFAAAAASSARQQLNSVALAESRKGLYRLFSAQHDYPVNWAQFLNPAPGSDQVLTLAMPPERFPFGTSGMDLKVRGIDVLANTSGTGAYTLILTSPAGQAQTVSMTADPTMDGMHHVSIQFNPAADLGRTPTPSTATPPTWTLKLQQAGAADFRSLTASDLDDIVLVVAYEAS